MTKGTRGDQRDRRLTKGTNKDAPEVSGVSLIGPRFITGDDEGTRGPAKGTGGISLLIGTRGDQRDRRWLR